MNILTINRTFGVADTLAVAMAWKPVSEQFIFFLDVFCSVKKNQKKTRFYKLTDSNSGFNFSFFYWTMNDDPCPSKVRKSEKGKLWNGG